MTAPLARAALVMLLLLGAGACASPVRVQPWSLEDAYLESYSSALTSDRPTAFSDQVLLRLGLAGRFEEDPAGALGALHATLAPSGDEDRLFALAELSMLHARRSGDRAHFLAAAVYAWAFLVREPGAPPLLALDPRNRIAADVYNAALALALEAPRPEGSTGQEATVVLGAGSHRLPFGTLDVVAPETVTWNERPLQRFVPAIQYDVQGLRNRYRDPGLGAPLIAVFAPDVAKADRARPLVATSSAFVSVAALLRIQDVRRGLGTGRLQGALSVHARDAEPSVSLGGVSVPLEFEPSATLAYALKDSPVLEMEFGGFFGLRSRLLDREPAVLRAVTPYLPSKIPVVLVHGTASSPLRWAELFNELTADQRVASRYQFWVFTYTSGNPIAFSAGLLRQALSRTIEVLDPNGENPALHRMVVIGHSQGGLLTKLTVVDSGTRFWDNVSKTPLDELKLGEETRSILRRSMFVTPLPFVKRVVFVATPHRGTHLAERRVAQWVARLIALPGTVLATGTELFRAVGSAEAGALRRMPSSLDNMSPSHPFVRTLSSLRVDPGVTAHSIVAVSGKGPLEKDGDGVVPYASAHIEEAVSEKVVRSGHSVQGQPEAIEEIRRILLEHLGVRDAPAPR